MAPGKSRSIDVELQQPAITKPHPLKIIKCSSTISSSSPAKDLILGGRKPSCASRGSPPPEPFRPLTVTKKRGRHRASVMHASMENISPVSSESTISDMIRKRSENERLEDTDTTPKAKKHISRTTSAGNFLLSELHERSGNVESNPGSIPHHRQPFPVHPQYTATHNSSSLSRKNNRRPEIPERRPSKSKGFFLRAFAGRISDEIKEARRLKEAESLSTKDTLIRRFSRGKYKDVSTPSDGSISPREPTCVGSGGLVGMLEFDHSSRSTSQEAISIATSASDSSFDDELPCQGVHVLSPQIFVTPELSVLEPCHRSLWVAIEIIGTLQNSDGGDHNHGGRRNPSGAVNTRLSDIRRYGELHSMAVELIPGDRCRISEVIGDIHTLHTLRAGEAHLILAKIRFGIFSPSRHLRETSSDELMAELENDLSDVITPYLTVRLLYKHSGFINYKLPGVSSEEMKSHVTRLQTEATAVIKRHNPQSAWSPRTSLTINPTEESNPLFNLIDRYMSKEQSQEAVRKIAEDRAQIPFPMRFCRSSEETALSESPASIDGTFHQSLNQKHSVPKEAPRGVQAVMKGSPPLPVRTPSALAPLAAPEDKTDPARRIWSEMRRTSRGGKDRMHPRLNMNRYSSDEEDNYCVPNTVTSPYGLLDLVNSPSMISIPLSIDYQDSISDLRKERSKIIETALKNKRSLGADTLRSLAPTVQNRGKPNHSPRTPGGGGIISSIGLGSGRSWGWGSSWW